MCRVLQLAVELAIVHCPYDSAHHRSPIVGVKLRDVHLQSGHLLFCDSPGGDVIIDALRDGLTAPFIGRPRLQRLSRARVGIARDGADVFERECELFADDFAKAVFVGVSGDSFRSPLR